MREKGMTRSKGESKGKAAIKLWTGATFAAFLAAAAIYAVLLWVEKNELAAYEKGKVYVSASEIPEGQMLTAENVAQYFAEEMLDAKLIPETAITALSQLEGTVARYPVEQGVFVTAGMFTPIDRITAGMREPVVAGFQAEDLSQVAGGVLRAGDWIHVYASEEEGTFLIWENVYVQQVFDSGGAVIGSDDLETAAQRINVFLDKEDVEAFYTRLDQGTLRVVKIWRQGKE